MGAAAQRVVVVTRATPWERLLADHGTRQQAEFFLTSRGRESAPVLEAHQRVEAARAAVRTALPTDWRSARIDRADLDRFLFEPDDVVVTVGQDGLVANAAKYLRGQPVVGVNPDAEVYSGVLARIAPQDVQDAIREAATGTARAELRTMASAELDDGQRLLALNEVFIGHRSHQTARYQLARGERRERQMSSGLIVSTGTGATGWARSICEERAAPPGLPAPEDAWLTFLVREAFGSPTTGTGTTQGACMPPDSLDIVSEMDEGGVVFGDGLEADRMEFPFGSRLTVGVAEERLRLVVG